MRAQWLDRPGANLMIWHRQVESSGFGIYEFASGIDVASRWGSSSEYKYQLAWRSTWGFSLWFATLPIFTNKLYVVSGLGQPSILYYWFLLNNMRKYETARHCGGEHGFQGYPVNWLIEPFSKNPNESKGEILRGGKSHVQNWLPMPYSRWLK